MAARLSRTLLRTQSDQRLIALAAAQGSEPAFEALVERYRKPLQGYCRRMLLPAEMAEDVVQQAFLSTWQALDGGTEVRDVRAWLYRVTHNAAINALKRSGYDHAQLDEALHGAAAPEDDLERRIAVRRTLAGLAALPELQREALLRTAVEGQSHEDVARALGLTDGAVRGLVYRARSTLRTAATALTPGPLVQWAASIDSASAPLGERIGELVAGGGSLGATALLVKGGATVLTAGALVGGVAVVEERRGDRRGSGDAKADVRRSEPAATEPSRPSASKARTATLGDASDLRETGAGRDEDADRRPRRRTGVLPVRDEDDDDGDDDSSGSGPGRGGTSGHGGDEDEDDEAGTSGSSGPGSGREDEVEGDDSSGPGGGADNEDGDDSSGPGPGPRREEEPDEPEEPEQPDDSSGPGSSATDSSGSGSSGSGSRDEDEEPEDDD